MKKILIIVLSAAFFCACVKDDKWGAATIADVVNTEAMTASDIVTVTATVTSLNGIKKVVLLYFTGNNEEVTSVDMTNDGISSFYTAEIPAQSMGTTVSYYIEALSGSNDITISNTYNYTVGTAPADYSGLCINELNGDVKFIELYNSSSETISLQGIYIIKDAETRIWTGADNLEITAGGFILLYSVDVEADHTGYDTNLFFDSGLSKKKSVSITLYNPSDEIIDEFTRGTEPWGTNISDSGNDSYALCPDASDNWQLATPTPGTANPTTGNGNIPQD